LCEELHNISLALNDNNITDTATSDISAVFSVNLQMKEIDLGKNNLQNMGCAIIFKALSIKSEL